MYTPSTRRRPHQHYEISVFIAMSAIGFALGTAAMGTAAMVALGVRWSWLIVLVIAGVVAQFNATARPRGSLRASWTDSGGRQLRTL